MMADGVVGVAVFWARSADGIKANAIPKAKIRRRYFCASEFCRVCPTCARNVVTRVAPANIMLKVGASMPALA
jgi:hypothetical protein